MSTLVAPVLSGGMYDVPVHELPSDGEIHYPTNGDELRRVFEIARGGDMIVLGSGLEYEGPFVVPPASSSGDQWVYVIGDNIGSLSEYSRVGSSAFADMPKLTTYSSSETTLTIQQGTSRYRFCGIEIASDYASRSGTQSSVVSIGVGGSGEASEIVFDRCYIHGTATGNNQNGVYIYNVDKCAIARSYLDEFHVEGNQSRGIYMYSSCKRVIVYDNYIASAGIGVLVGGTTTTVPEDIVVRGNNIYKYHKWKTGHADDDGINWQVLHHIAIQAVTRLLCECNVCEQTWADDSSGWVFVISSSNGAISDVTIRRNIAREFGGMAIIFGISNPLTDVLFDNNLCFDQNVATTYAIQIQAASGNFPGLLRIRNNTMLASASSGWIWLSGTHGSDENEIADLEVYDNIATAGTYEIYSNTLGNGQDGPAYYCASHLFDTNVMIGGSSLIQSVDDGDDWTNFSYPATNSSVGFVDTTFDNVPSDYALDSGSAYHNAGTDGTDIGCDISQLSCCPSVLGETGEEEVEYGAEAATYGPNAFSTTAVEGDETAINSVPYEINSGGTYKLTGNLSADNTAISINASNVVLDLNGYTLTYGANGSSATGLYTYNSTQNSDNGGHWGVVFGRRTNLTDDLVLNTASKSNITIKNGTIQDGASAGMEYSGAICSHSTSTVSVEDVVINVSSKDGLGIWGPYSSITATRVEVNNTATTVNNRHALPASFCQVKNASYCDINGGPCVGILTRSSGDINHNRIRHDTRVVNGYGISTRGADNASLTHNVIQPDNGRGIHIDSNDGTTCSYNTVIVTENPDLISNLSEEEIHGIKMESGADPEDKVKNAQVDHNYVKVLSGGDDGHPTALNFHLTSGASDNIVEYNWFEAEKQEGDSSVAAAVCPYRYINSGVLIRNCVFKSNHWLVRMLGVTTGTLFTNCEFRGVAGETSGVYHGANVWADEPSTDTVDVTFDADCTFTDCSFDDYTVGPNDSEACDQTWTWLEHGRYELDASTWTVTYTPL